MSLAALLPTLRTLLLVACALLAGCGDVGDSNVQQASGALAGLTTPGPRDVTQSFLDAATGEDDAAAVRWLTRAARERWNQPDGGKFDGGSITTYTLGPAKVDGDRAEVPVTLEDERRSQPVRFQLRRENGPWRLHGMVVDLGGTDFCVDFEGGPDSMTEIGEALTEGIAESMQQSMQEWQATHEASEREAQQRSYAALRSCPPAMHERAWKVDVEGGGRSARAILEELLADTGVRLDTDAALETALDLSLRNISRVQAIEEVAAARQLVPVYEGADQPWAEEAGVRVGFRPGPRRRPVAFAGPFAIEVTDVQEEAPHTVGALTLQVRSLGLDPAVQALMSEMFEGLRLDAVTDTRDRELRREADLRWMSTPTQSGALATDDYQFELRGLLRDVQEIARIRGTVRLQLPGRVEEVALDSLAPGPHVTPGWNAEVKSTGNSFELTLRSQGPENWNEALVRFDPRDARGEPLRLLYSSASSMGDRIRGGFQTDPPAARVGLKIVAPQTLEYPFELRGIPFAKAGEQPEGLAELRFEGAVPLRVAFHRFVDRSNPDLVSVELKLSNPSTKTVRQATVVFEYLDSRGQVQEEFSHTLSGAFDGRVTAPLCATRADETLETPAFFMPAETHTVQVRLERVTFMDGTEWSAAP